MQKWTKKWAKIRRRIWGRKCCFLHNSVSESAPFLPFLQRKPSQQLIGRPIQILLDRIILLKSKSNNGLFNAGGSPPLSSVPTLQRGLPPPVVNRKGEHSVAVLSISDHLDPQDIANYSRSRCRSAISARVSRGISEWHANCILQHGPTRFHPWGKPARTSSLLSSCN